MKIQKRTRPAKLCRRCAKLRRNLSQHGVITAVIIMLIATATYEGIKTEEVYLKAMPIVPWLAHYIGWGIFGILEKNLDPLILVALALDSVSIFIVVTTILILCNWKKAASSLVTSSVLAFIFFAPFYWVFDIIGRLQNKEHVMDSHPFMLYGLWISYILFNRKIPPSPAKEKK